MISITSLDKVSRQAVGALAEAAADRGDAMPENNPFPLDSDNHKHFAAAFKARSDELEPAG